jgi:predicted dehydrogenase
MAEAGNAAAERILRVGLVGLGSVCGAVHHPGLAGIPGVELAGICDTDPQRLAQRASDWKIHAAYGRIDDLLCRQELDAVVVATPNATHSSLVKAVLAAGCHVLCEKPLGLDHAQAASMLAAATASGRRHMTAFTYRFVPGMRYLKHLVDTGALGQIRHARFQRLQHWGERAIGWRQYRDQAGSGEMADMGIHRIDFAQDLLGPISSVCGHTRRLLDRTVSKDGAPCAAQDVEDWAGWIAEFAGGATGMFEMGKLTKGRGPDGGHDLAELNGSEASAVYQLHTPHEVLFAPAGEAYTRHPVPETFLKLPGSPRDPHEGDPLRTFRYDQEWEFISAIRHGRACVPSFAHGTHAQAVADAVIEAAASRRWVDVSAG